MPVLSLLLLHSKNKKMGALGHQLALFFFPSCASVALARSSHIVVGVLAAQLVLRHSCVADRLPVVVRFPAGPRVSLKSGDQPKGRWRRPKKKRSSHIVVLVNELFRCIFYVLFGESKVECGPLRSPKSCQAQRTRDPKAKQNNKNKTHKTQPNKPNPQNPTKEALTRQLQCGWQLTVEVPFWPPCFY